MPDVERYNPNDHRWVLRTDMSEQTISRRILRHPTRAVVRLAVPFSSIEFHEHRSLLQVDQRPLLICEILRAIEPNILYCSTYSINNVDAIVIISIARTSHANVGQCGLWHISAQERI